MITVTTQAALTDLRDGTCACGKAKARGKSHCRKCYFKLPKAMRGALYSPLEQGYEEAYTESLEYLGLESPAMELESEYGK